jgi:hypothetical protein
MLDPFLEGNRNLVNQLGLLCTYKVIQQGAYDVDTSSVSTTSTEYQIKAVQGNLRKSEQESPNFIGKQSCALYILPSALFVPKPSDSVVYDSDNLEVKVVIKQRGLQGPVAGYKLLCVKG